MKKVLFALCAAALFAGCATVEVSSEGGRVVANAVNSSWTFLFVVPIGSGDVETPNRKLCNWFENSATVTNNVRLLNYAVQKKGAKGFKNPVSRTYGESFMFLFQRHICQTSAELEM